MQALILAAGCGNRLRPLTDHVPKSLVEVNGIPLLVNALDCLSERGIQEVLIVVGDKKDMIISRLGFKYKEMRIVYIDNTAYLETNNIYSFWLARDYIKDDVIMLECDLFYRRNLIDKILEGEGDCRMLVTPFNEEYMDGTVVTIDDSNQVKSLIIKCNQVGKFDYSDKLKTVNVYWFKKEFIKNKLLHFIDTYIRTQSVNSYYELVLGGIIYWGNNDIRAVTVAETEWSEIDDIEDLEKANIKFA